MFLNLLRGIHVPHRKDTADCPPQRIPIPATVSLPMSMHIGKPALPTVKPGDLVKVGQRIAEPDGPISAPIHASVSGQVRSCGKLLLSNGQVISAVVIDSDGRQATDPSLRPPAVTDYASFLAAVRDSGAVGLGGAGFPTHVKISSGIGKVDTLILNGAECEPYITADHRLMLEQGERVIGGARILMQAFGLQSATIGVEANKPDAIEHLQALVGARADVHVESLRTRYPQGAEKQLIQRLTGREVPPGGLPAHVGCAVFNVGTAAAVYDAVVEGKPVTHRIVTVTGDAVKEPCNLLVPLGTSFQHLIDEAKGFAEEPDRVLTGGPMMGIAQHTLEVGIIKGTNAVLCLTRKEAAPIETEEVCLRCARCVNVCPMHLTPVYMHLYAGKGMWKEAEALNVMDCIECGSCNYICPGRLHLVQSFRMTKMELRQLAAKEKAAKEAAKA